MRRYNSFNDITGLPQPTQVIDERGDLQIVQIELRHFPAGENLIGILEQPREIIAVTFPTDVGERWPHLTARHIDGMTYVATGSMKQFFAVIAEQRTPRVMPRRSFAPLGCHPTLSRVLADNALGQQRQVAQSVAVIQQGREINRDVLDLIAA